MANDYSPIGPVPSGIANGTVDATSRQLARDMRGKAYGKDVRETIARMTEWHSIRTSAAEVLAKAMADEAKRVNQQVTNQLKSINDELSEGKDYYSLPEIAGARGGFRTLGERLNYDLGDENILRLVHQVVSKGDEIFTPIGLEQFMTTQNGAWEI